MNNFVKRSFFVLLVSTPYSICSADMGDLGAQNFASYLQSHTSQVIASSYSNSYSPNNEQINKSSVIDKSANVAIEYTVSQQRRKKNLANFVAKTRATDPAGAAQMEQVFASGDIIDIVDNAMQGKGLTASNAADAYAVWWVSAWQATQGDTREWSGAAYQAVSAQAARGFGATAQFASATDAQKQEMAEAMLVQAVMIDQFKDTYANDPASKQKLADAVRQGAKKSGLDLDAMTLTEDGFVKAKGRKTGAADDTNKAANPNAPATAIAANATGKGEGESGEGKGEGDNTLNYALIAAAAGAGLGGVFLFGKAMGKKG
jgi:hypothetical protein